MNVQLSLEPNANPAGKAFQQAMFAQSIPPMSAVGPKRTFDRCVFSLTNARLTRSWRRRHDPSNAHAVSFSGKCFVALRVRHLFWGDVDILLAP